MQQSTPKEEQLSVDPKTLIGYCPFCKAVITEDSFRNKISLKEYCISGLCQSCQDDIFGKD